MQRVYSRWNLKLRAHVLSATRLSCHWSSAPSSKRGRSYLQLRDRLHEGGEPQVGEVICGKLPHLTCKRDHIKMRDYMDLIIPPKRVTSPTWGPLPPCKQALNLNSFVLPFSPGQQSI